MDPGRTIRPALHFALPLSALLLAGCDIEFAGQDLQLRPNADGSLDFLLVYRGVSASGDSAEAVEKALAIAHRFLAGRREFASPLWPGHVDLDSPETYKDLDEEAAALLSAITLEESGVFLDPEGRLSAYQRLRLPDLACALSCLNRRISGAVLPAAGEGPPEAEGDPDERTQALWIERARSGGPWVSFRDGAFAVDLPMTRATADRLQRKLIDEVAKSGGELNGLPGLLSHLRRLSIEEERVLLEFAAPETGVFNLGFDQREAQYRPGLHDALAAEGVHPDPSLTLEQVRAILLP
ncbi:MAG: hypothetical protein ACRD2T_11645 [Thermoanaerobaculia bacterium]